MRNNADAATDSKRAYAHRRYRSLRQQGLCVLCGITPTGGRVYCPECSARLIATQAQLHAQRNARGQCYRCYRPAAPGKKQCFMHLLETSERVKRCRDKRMEQYRAMGMCVDCGKNPPKEGFQRCEGCLDKIRLQMIKHRLKEAANG